MEIIKQPKYPEKNVVICNNCSCEFRYFDSEIKVTTIGDFENATIYRSMNCPGCGTTLMLSINGEKCDD